MERKRKAVEEKSPTARNTLNSNGLRLIGKADVNKLIALYHLNINGQTTKRGKDKKII
jgi:hypothetical protein